MLLTLLLRLPTSSRLSTPPLRPCLLNCNLLEETLTADMLQAHMCVGPSWRCRNLARTSWAVLAQVDIAADVSCDAHSRAPIAQHGTIWHGPQTFGITQHGTAWPDMALHCIDTHKCICMLVLVSADVPFRLLAEACTGLGH